LGQLQYGVIPGNILSGVELVVVLGMGTALGMRLQSLPNVNEICQGVIKIMNRIDTNIYEHRTDIRNP